MGDHGNPEDMQPTQPEYHAYEPPEYIRSANLAKPSWATTTAQRRLYGIIGAVVALGIIIGCIVVATGGTGTSGAHSSAHVGAVAQQTSPTSTPAPTNTAGPTPTPTATPVPPTPTATSVPPTPIPAPTWQTVQTFRGNGISKTSTFTENADQWKIVWSCNPRAYGSEYNLIADLTPPGQSFGDTVVNVICSASDPSTTKGETMEYSQGTFYLDVNSEASWTFQIQELK